MDTQIRAAAERRAGGRRTRLPRTPWSVLGAIALGGGLGGLARYGLGMWAPAAPGEFPWTSLAVNVSGSALIGVVMVLVTELWPQRRLLRPLLGIGVLGGYTTFSFHMLEAQHLIAHPAVLTAALYLAGTVVAALLAVAAGAFATRWLLRQHARAGRSAA